MRLRKIIIAPDSFKETLSAPEVTLTMAEGVMRALPKCDVVKQPVADGGEGTLDCLTTTGSAITVEKTVRGPLGELIKSRFAVIPRDDSSKDHGIVEMALASGLALVPLDRRDPMRTTSFGMGELMLAAIESGCMGLIVCIGGSATVDGGTGIAQACGFRFFDSSDREITEQMCGGLLQRIARIEPPLRSFPPVRVACDVTNPLYGPNGAAAVYGPQKGATPEQVRLLDEGLAHLAKVAGGDPNMPGAGAAGGAGYGLVTFFNATLERGIDLVLETVRFRDRCRGADLVITGEGRLDRQSLQGKACLGVAKAAAECGVPTIAIVGSTGPGADDCVKRGLLMSYHSLADRYGMERAMRETKALLAELAEQVVRDLILR